MNKIATVRGSDKSTFKRCRRLWNWTSHLKENLRPLQTAAPLWMGSMMHYGLEDFHGYKRYKTAKHAGEAYVAACIQYAKVKDLPMPVEWQHDAMRCLSMLEYYEDVWLPIRTDYPTYVRDGVPQVEVNVSLPLDDNILYKLGNRNTVDSLLTQYPNGIEFRMQFDRVSIDDADNLWIVEYKTAASFQTDHLALDPQITAYLAAAEMIYPEKNIAGVIYQQHKKHLVKDPEPLKAGTLSIKKDQATSHTLYRKKLLEIHGNINEIPEKNIEYLNTLAEKQDDNKDYFIKRDFIERSALSLSLFKHNLVYETIDMLNPDIVLYPNPTRDCGRMCAFHDACKSMEDGDDVKLILDATTMKKEDTYDPWRKYLPDPESDWKVTI